MDYYNSSDAAAPSEAQDKPAEKTDSDEGKDEEQTALVPKSLLGGKDFGVGDEIIFKIVHKYEDEIEVAYASEPKKEDKPKSQMEESEGGLDRMAKPPMEA